MSFSLVFGFYIFIISFEFRKNNNHLIFILQKGGILKVHYTWKGKNKPVGTLFVGTSPEFELSLYTVCFLIRPNDKCYLRVGGKDIFIQTYTFTARNQKLIGSAFPGIV